MMTDDEMQQRMKRVYAAVDAVVDEDPDSVGRCIVEAVKAVEAVGGFGFDAGHGWDQAKLENHAFMLIHNVAQLQDHARRWLKASGQDKDQVTKLVQSNKSIQLLMDLSNKDKHGGDKRHGELYSGTQPFLKSLMRVLVLKSAPGMNQTAGIWGGVDGQINIAGTPSFNIWAVVCDAEGKPIMNLRDVLSEAIEAWEHLLREAGLPLEDDWARRP